MTTTTKKKYTSPKIKDLILRVNANGVIEVANMASEGAVEWREATHEERELFGERIWEG